MKTFKRISDISVEIDGVRYYSEAEPDKAEPVKPEWPTTMYQVDESIEDYHPIIINTNDQSKGDAICRCIDIARVINGDWKPDWKDDKAKYYPTLHASGSMQRGVCHNKNGRDQSFVWFETPESLEHFAEYFGEIWLEAIG